MTTESNITADISAAKRSLELLKIKLHDLLHEEWGEILKAIDSDDPRWMDWHRVCIALMHVNQIDIRKYQ